MAIVSEALVDQLDREKRTVSFDAFDISVQQLIDMVKNGQIEIAPDYQRHFVWKEPRESELIESVFLGLPIPSLFMAANKDGTWEVVDGVQRLSTLLHYFGSDELLDIVGRKSPLSLEGLTKITSLNGSVFSTIPKSVQFQFLLRPLKVTTLNDRSDLNVRYELFERLNTGGVELHAQEIRNCVFRGNLRSQLKSLSGSVAFRKVVLLRKDEKTDATYEECVLRFFAFLDRYGTFDHLVTRFLTDYAKEKNQRGIEKSKIDLFEKTMDFLVSELPEGIVRKGSTTPLNLYEAVAVGTALVLQEHKTPKKGVLPSLIKSSEMDKFSKGGTNTRAMVKGRIELVSNALT